MTAQTEIPVGSVGSGGSVGFNTSAALDEVRAWLNKYIAATSDMDLDILTLWIAHTYVATETYYSPRLIIDSVMPGSGKTTVLEHIQHLGWSPILAASVGTPSLLAHLFKDGPRTLLLDEVDRTLDPSKPGVGDLVAILNSGYKRGATRPVNEKDGKGNWAPVMMPTFGPVAMAGNSPQLAPDTRQRSLRILLMPDLDGRTEFSDWEEIESNAETLAKTLSEAMDGIRARVGHLKPELPAGCIGRAKERWWALRRVAEAAQGDWPAVCDELIRRDLKEVDHEREDGLTSKPLPVVILEDLHEVWPDADRFVSSERLVSLLIRHDPSHWGLVSHYGKDLTVQRMGRILAKDLKIYSDRVGDSPRGYHKYQFANAWSRFHIPTRIETDGTARTDGTDGNGGQK